MAAAKNVTGQVVWCDYGEGPMLGLFVKSAGDKDLIQVPNGRAVELAYREPKDRDAGGSGRTWWKV